jgi:hypothetical protein
VRNATILRTAIKKMEGFVVDAGEVLPKLKIVD